MALIVVTRDQLAAEFPEWPQGSTEPMPTPDWTRVDELHELADRMAADLFAGLDDDDRQRLWRDAQEALAAPLRGAA
jgi:hypothetical protein